MLDIRPRYQALVTSCSNAADSNSALEILDEMQRRRTSAEEMRRLVEEFADFFEM